MQHQPDFETFSQRATQATYLPVSRTLYSDTLTPVSAFYKSNWEREAFLFESVVGGEKVGRYSFLGGNPFLRIEAFGNEIRLIRGDEVESRTVDDPLDELAKLIDEHQSMAFPELPKFVGGAVGYAGYDVVRYTEHLPNPPTDDRELPDMSFGFYDEMVVFDHIRKTTMVIVHARTDTDDLKAEYDSATARVDALCARLSSSERALSTPDVHSDTTATAEWTSNMTQQEYMDAVSSCQEYIKAGDIFQVVLSQRLALETAASPLDVYRALRVVNPSPFMFLLQTSQSTLVGSSPEIMVRVDDRKTTIRPLAGTRKRGATPAEDDALAAELLADPKERAEHVMLIDLARNDVGRIAKYGTVTLNDVMVVERYSHVMHITSNVYGDLKDGLSSLDALRAGLPAGTVSGAPKVRAMEIIDEMEVHRRGPYAGAVGYIDFTGNMDTCIALRTIVMQRNSSTETNTAFVQAGAGIVADSVPELEYQETLSKAQGLIKAIQLAETITQTQSE